jgi:ATP-dependent helicase/nuclease subunit A
MAGGAAVRNISDDLARTSRNQADAADPRACVWVSANAGTGKTHVLTMRVLRLMLGGTAPQRILCLTYTKAAAAEMSKRVFDELASWVTLPPKDLSAKLQELTGQKPAPADLALARTLFTAAIETPGGLKVQTIHAFCERLLQRFPLEAGVTPGFSILEDEKARKLRREAIDEMLTNATRDPKSALGRALTTAIAYAAEDRFDEVLTEALRHREWLDAAARLPSDTPKGSSGLAAVEALFNAHFGVRAKATPELIAQELAKLVPDTLLSRVRDVLSTSSPKL